MKPLISISLISAVGCLLFAGCATKPISQYDQQVDSKLPRNVGVARINITPEEPIRLSGYGSRREVSDGVEGKLWAKALAIGEGNEPALLVTLDLIGVPEWLTTAVVKELKIPASQIAICATHTHSGPHLKNVLDPIFMADIPADHSAGIERYSAKLADKVVEVCQQAMINRKPGSISWGQGEVGFAGNRRVLENAQWTGFGTQPNGPVDHSLPVMKISDSSGELLAVLTNYACHCTTLGGDFNQIHGDWAGEAQRLLEERHPGVTVMIAIGCGADANPNPRGSMENVLQHAKTLADEVDRVISGELIPLPNRPHTRLEHITLPFDPLPTREDWVAHANSEIKSNYYAKQILGRLDRGEELPTSINYPIQTWTFGEDLAMVFLAGEVVVDYSLKLKQRFDSNRLWVNAYANASPSYIASRRLYDEGGYEVDRSMYYYDKPTRLSPDTEELVLDEVLQQLPYTFYASSTLSLMPAPSSKEQALATMEVHPDLQIELVAAEPLVMDPIDVAWGADGRMWVVEMADYPLGIDGKGKGGGRIRYLEDTDKDGHYDKSTLFMDAVPFPTSVFPWKDGVLVTTPPDLLFARDTTNDGKADDVSPLYTGFNLGNQQHLVNGMQWGLDGWIYLANGDSGGKVRPIDSDQTIDIDGRDLRIKPETGEIEAILGRSQYGRNRDSWGNWFGNSNSQPGWHFALDDNYLRRNRYVNYANARVSLPEISGAGPVFPISKTLSRFNDYEKANRFTSASGFMIYEDSALGSSFIGNSFVAEPVHNLVSRAVLYPKGSSFRSERVPEEQDSEFLRSTDNWFRPTSIRSGPDGALYITDMYRLAIEHPEWIPEDWQRKLNLREGHDKGRIYRISKKGTQWRPVPDLSRLSTSELVGALNSDIRWQRDQAHQLLVIRDDSKADDAIKRTALRAKNPKTRGQALWVLSQVGALDGSTLLEALNDTEAGVRVQAIKLSDAYLENEEVLQRVAELAEDESAQVRIQVAYTLGESSTSLAGETLLNLSLKHHEDPLMLSAILSSVQPHQQIFAEKLGSQILETGFQNFRTGLLQTAIGTKNQNTLAVLLKTILSQSEVYPIQNYLTAYRDYRNALDRFSSENNGVIESSVDLKNQENQLFKNAEQSITDPNATSDLRILALSVLPYNSIEKASNAELALQLLNPSNATELQLAAVESLARILESETPKTLLENWNVRSPTIRNKILGTLLTRTDWTIQLLKAAAQNPIISKSFSVAHKNQLSFNSDETIRELAETAFSQFTTSNREQLVQDYQPTLNLEGDPVAGRGHFSSRCATCHNMDGIGVDVGPNLSSLSDKSPQSLLIAILDPNRAVENKYNQFVATTRNNETAVGILSEETGNSVTLTTTGGLQQTLLRQNLDSLESSGISLMPEGLEAGLDHQQMADLLAFLNASDESLKIRAETNGEIALASNRAIITGSSAYYNPDMTSIEWIRQGDAIQWIVYDLKPGLYDIFCEAGLTNEYTGRPFKLHLNDTFVTGAVVTSNGMDRFRKRKFGNIEIKSEIPKAVFRLEHTLANAEFGLKELRLIPVP
jgi:putative membrane-bound dehydrogenase-like protein